MPTNKLVELSKQLDVTAVLKVKATSEEKAALIHKLIERYDGFQDHVTGTVILSLPVDDEDAEGASLNLWVHDWED